MLESLAVDIESRISGLWKEVRPEECFIAQYNDISNYIILVIKRGIYSVLLFSGIVTNLRSVKGKKKVIFLLPSLLDFVDLLKSVDKFVCGWKSAPLIKKV